LVGIVPRDDNIVEVDPLIPAASWEWFCLDGVAYHGQQLTIVWDRMGQHFKRGAGLAIWANGKEIARSANLNRLTGKLPSVALNN
jgi:hypothetical protein